jgi:hypothetical protein
MDKFYPLMIIFSTAFTAKAQIPAPASPATGNASNCTTTPNIYCQHPGEIKSRFIYFANEQ